jgi:hypothetical protein
MLAGFLQYQVQAESAGAGETAVQTVQADPGERLALTLHCLYEGKPLENLLFDVYYVGEVSDGELKLSESFESYAVGAMDLRSSDWRLMAETLAGYAQRDAVPALLTGSTDANGLLELPAGSDTLSPGVYLCEAHLNAESGDGIIYSVEPLLVSLPEQAQDGTPVYDVDVYPKIRRREVEGTFDLTVMKVWKDSATAAGTTGSTAETSAETSPDTVRPSQIEVQLLKNGEVQDGQTVVLNAANNWQYTWTGLDDTAEWTAVEKEVPANYTVMTSLENNYSRIVITNTEMPSTEPPQSESETEPPQTEVAPPTETETETESTQTESTVSKPSQSSSSGGSTLPQTGMLWWPVPVLTLAGLALFVIGWIIHRKNSEK